MLLASYTWGQDALRWGAMGHDKRIEQALEDVEKIHPEIVREFEVGASHSWYEDPFAAGAFALFEPEQQTRLHDTIVAPEGRILFAGEHCSLWHAWIEGGPRDPRSPAGRAGTARTPAAPDRDLGCYPLLTS